MAVPIMDTTLVTVKRLLSGRRISDGGRDHTSHRLVALGLSERRAVLTPYAVSAGFGLLALDQSDVYLGYALVAFAAVGVVIFAGLLGNVTVYRPEEERLGRLRSQGRNGSDHVVLRAVLRNKKRIAGVVADLLLVIAAFVLAHYLRFETGMNEGILSGLVQALPLVAAIKVTTFHAFGLYRGIWRYAGSYEVLQAVKASTVASALCVGALVMLFRFEGDSRSVFVIDWLLTTMAIVGVRSGYRVLWGYLAAKRARGQGVLLHGADAAGALALREIRQNSELGMVPVGFLDDDPEKVGRTVERLPVLGYGRKLGAIARRCRSEEVLLTISELPPEPGGGPEAALQEVSLASCRR